MTSEIDERHLLSLTYITNRARRLQENIRDHSASDTAMIQTSTAAKLDKLLQGLSVTTTQ